LLLLLTVLVTSLVTYVVIGRFSFRSFHYCNRSLFLLCAREEAVKGFFAF
jgi:hypothetical protein